MAAINAITWQLLLGEQGRLIGIALNSDFARLCWVFRIGPDGQERARSYVWRFAKPVSWKHDYVSSNILQFEDDSLLVSIFQLHDDSGKWLDVNRFSVLGDENGELLIFNFHHASDTLDGSANQRRGRKSAPHSRLGVQWIHAQDLDPVPQRHHRPFREAVGEPQIPEIDHQADLAPTT